MASFRDRVSVDGQEMRVYVSVPDGKGPLPSVVVIQHQGGVDEFIEEMTERVASAGYVGAAPDLYHRDDPDCRDDGNRYHAQADRDSWPKTLAFFAKHLGRVPVAAG